MGPPRVDAVPSPLAHALSRLRVREWRMPRIETYPRLVAFAQTWPGRLLLAGSFIGLMKLNSRGMWIEDNHLWLLVAVAPALVALAGRYRGWALLACTALLLARFPAWYDYRAVRSAIEQEHLSPAFDTWHLRSMTLIGCAMVAVLALWLARRLRDQPLGRRPVLVQHLLLCGLIALAVSHLLHGLPQVVLWSVIATFVVYFWFLAYALIDQRKRRPAPLAYPLATFNPFYWSTPVPIGKGGAHWRTLEARTAQELAVTQLKAVKLLAWAYVIKLVLWLLRSIVYGKLGVVPLDRAFEQFLLVGRAPPLALASVIVNFPEQLLIFALWGHVIVATARFAGFRLLRNTWRPLGARTIAEFWNRYYYYFKELLVDVYFYPTYLRYCKRSPRLRIALATFMAAGAGNFFFHLTVMEAHTMARSGIVEALVRSQTYAFYCVLLVTGIVASQLRTQRPGPAAGWWRGRAVPFLGVAAFYCFLSFFDGPQRHVSLLEHFRFLGQVAGLGV